jgi:hypothetical protein
VVTAPDLIEMDRSIVTHVDIDPVLAKLARSLVEFAHGIDVRVGAGTSAAPAPPTCSGTPPPPFRGGCPLRCRSGCSPGPW